MHSLLHRKRQLPTFELPHIRRSLHLRVFVTQRWNVCCNYTALIRFLWVSQVRWAASPSIARSLVAISCAFDIFRGWNFCTNANFFTPFQHIDFHLLERRLSANLNGWENKVQNALRPRQRTRNSTNLANEWVWIDARRRGKERTGGEGGMASRGWRKKIWKTIIEYLIRTSEWVRWERIRWRCQPSHAYCMLVQANCTTPTTTITRGSFFLSQPSEATVRALTKC